MSVLERGRRMAESRMLDSCKVFRLVKSGPLNDETRSYPMTEVVAYEGRCRVKHPTVAGRDADAGSQLVVVSQVEVHLPLGAVGVRPGDTVLLTACPTRLDQVGRKFTVAGPFDGSQTTALRFRVEVDDGR